MASITTEVPNPTPTVTNDSSNDENDSSTDDDGVRYKISITGRDDEQIKTKYLRYVTNGYLECKAMLSHECFINQKIWDHNREDNLHFMQNLYC
jgi:hypothetical protein